MVVQGEIGEKLSAWNHQWWAKDIELNVTGRYRGVILGHTTNITGYGRVKRQLRSSTYTAELYSHKQLSIYSIEPHASRTYIIYTNSCLAGKSIQQKQITQICIIW